MMRIGVSLLNFRPGCMGGIETYFLKLVEYLPVCADKKGDEIIFFVNQETQFFLEKKETSCVLNWSGRKTSTIRLIEAFTPLRARRVERCIANADLDVFFIPHQAIFPFHTPVPVVITAHDVQHLFFPHYFSLLDKLFRSTVWKRSLERADGIISISNFTARTLTDQCGVPLEKIAVVHHGYDASDIFVTASASRVVEPYLFYPSASYAHKGHARLFESYAALKKTGRMPFQLVLCGMKTPYWRKLEKLINKLGLSNDITHRGFVSREEVLQLYLDCEAVLFPTEFEGFGLPVLEAARFGKKCICSRLEIFDEIGVPSELQIDFSCPDEFHAALGFSGGMNIDSQRSWLEAVEATLSVVKGFVA